MARYSLAIYWVLICILMQLGLAKTRPEEGDTLNYTHVLFQWEQVPGATCYLLQVANDDPSGITDPFVNSLVVDVFDSSLVHIVIEGLEWGTNYIWQVLYKTSDAEYLLADIPRRFAILDIPEIDSHFTTSSYTPELIQPGLTLFADQFSNTSVAVSHSGQPVWFIVHQQNSSGPLRLTDLLPNGNILTIDWTGNPGEAFEKTISNQIIWTISSSTSGVHHDLIKMPSGHYLGLTNIQKQGYIPEGPWKDQFDQAGLDSVIWLGDRIIEWDETGNEVWSWSVFDHFEMSDFDSSTLMSAFNRGFHDWTHSNSVFFDSSDRAIYLSVRNLSRITKIAYPDGNILWSMGKSLPSGDATVGNDLRFSLQHSAKMLPNRNIMLYDNGHRNSPQLTRVMEIELSPTDSVPTIRVVWEYPLPDSLYTPTRGDADRLQNGNTLITAANPSYFDMNAQIIEVTPDSEIVWRLDVGEADTGTRRLYRSERIPGLYPQAFSVLMADFVLMEDVRVVQLTNGAARLRFSLHNEGWLNETYDYILTDSAGWFTSEGSIEVASGDQVSLAFTGDINDYTGSNLARLIIIPTNAPALADTISFIISSEYVIHITESTRVPTSFSLLPATPNPFNPSTNISYDLPKRSHVTLKVYDLQGRIVSTLVEGWQGPGQYKTIWNGLSKSGRPVAAGVYLYRLEAGSFSQTQKMLLLK